MHRSPNGDALLDALLNVVDDAVVLVDRAGKIRGWAGGAERIFGINSDEAADRAIESFFLIELRPELQRLVRRVVAGDVVRHLDGVAGRSDGLPVPVLVSAAPVPEGEGVAALVLVRDATEQVLEQAALAEASAQLQEGEAAAHVGRWAWDIGSGSVQWSPELHRIHGVDPLRFEGTIESHLAAVDPRDRQAVADAMAGATESGRGFEIEYRPVTAPGERVVRLRAEPALGPEGEVIGLRGLGHELGAASADD